MITKLNAFISEKINIDDLNADTPFEYKKQITLKNQIRSKINTEFEKMGDYFDTVSDAYKKIENILANYNIAILQEDYTPFEGFFTGKEGKSSLNLGMVENSMNTVIKNAKLIMTWHKLDKKFEIIKYIS